MTASSPPAEPVAGSRAKPPPPPRAEPAERGRLHISSLVLRRIAEHAADTTAGTVGRAAARGGGRGAAGGPSGAAARVRANGVDVDVELDVSLVYPQPIHETAQRLRATVVREVGRLTGRKVRRVAVNVVGLLPDIRPRVE